VTFSVSARVGVGEGGTILGVGNGDPSSHEPDVGPMRHAFNGSCTAIVRARSAGALHVRAAAPGLDVGEIEITCTEAARHPAA
jgi:beta-galactosidase